MSIAWEMGLLNYLNLLTLFFCSLYLMNKSFVFSLVKLMQLEALNCLQTRGRFGGGAGADALFQRFDPLPTRKVPPLHCFEIFSFVDGL